MSLQSWHVVILQFILGNELSELDLPFGARELVTTLHEAGL
jgi:hypothetical protein